MVTTGETVSHYRILEKLGDGGMGVVYRAHDEILDRDVAVKVLRQDSLGDETNRKRLRKEARVLSRLNHPNIELLFEFNTEGAEEFLAVEFVPGTSLSHMLTKEQLPEKEIVRLGKQLAEGLAAAHARGVVHCDLKPSNLRVTPEGRLKIIDFGIAKLLRPIEKPRRADGTTLSSSGNQDVVGTLPYMAPEQLRSETTDARTDIYAAGVILYEAATRRRPFQEETSPVLIDDILHQPPVLPRALNSRISPELERIILKCLRKEPENRYQSAQDLEVDLRLLATPASEAVVPVSGLKWAWRGRVKVAAIVLAILSALIVGLQLRRWQQHLLTSSTGRIESIAVLPLQNLSGNLEQDYFADGMTDELISSLAKISSLRVISRTSSMQYKGARKSLPQVGRELHVDAVVEGTVRRWGDHVKITADLIYAPTDRHLWSESYERDLRDVFALQSEVAMAIAQGINVKLTSQEKARLSTSRPVNPSAYEAYLQGRYYWNKRTSDGVTKGIAYFDRAIQIDPDYALAYAGLADSYLVLGDYRYRPPQDAFPKAKAAALKALEKDEGLAEAHAPLGSAEALYDRDWTSAEREFQRALELNPSYATAHLWYGVYLAEMGRLDQAFTEVKRAQQLDPLSPIISTDLGTLFYFARDYDGAIGQLRKTLEMDQTFFLAYLGLGDAYQQEGKYQEAVEAYLKAATLAGESPATVASLQKAYATSGWKGFLEEWLNQMLARTRHNYVAPYPIAELYMRLNQKDRALAWLEKAFEERSPELLSLKVDPVFDGLRSDSRFQNMLRRIGLAP
jgi:serine/threonine-protein kinase